MSEAVQAAQHEEHRNDQGSKIGMYLFLFTEIILFGGMFLLYAVYRYNYALDFHHAAEELNVSIGVINTVVLLTSSLTMAMSVAAHRAAPRSSRERISGRASCNRSRASRRVSSSIGRRGR